MKDLFLEEFLLLWTTHDFCIASFKK